MHCSFGGVLCKSVCREHKDEPMKFQDEEYKVGKNNLKASEVDTCKLCVYS